MKTLTKNEQMMYDNYVSLMNRGKSITMDLLNKKKDIQEMLEKSSEQYIEFQKKELENNLYAFMQLVEIVVKERIDDKF